ncbi:MAG: hypothetical protein FJX42_11240, partial [Alphaproteobacteria bacterium]|nr:hypothetical protein [Alphaproteobacteria bacterium]
MAQAMDSGVDEILRTRPARPSSGRAKGILSGLGIGHRLALALAIPAVALIVLTAVGVGRGWQAREKAVEVGDLALVLSGIGAVVHEVQKERGLSAGFVASRGTRFAAELRAQREASDQALAALDSTIAQAFRRRPDSGPVAHLALFKAHAGDIPETRARLDLFAMSDANVIDFYSTVLSQALLAGRTWSAAAGGTALNGPIWAHLELIEGKEHAGQERAIGNAMLSGSSFGGLFPRQFIELGVEQVAHFRTFQELAGAGFAADLDTIERGPAGTEIQRLRAAIGGLAGTSGVRPEAW